MGTRITITLLTLCAILGACTTTRTITETREVPMFIHDTLTIEKTRMITRYVTDSIYIHDSTVVESGTGRVLERNRDRKETRNSQMGDTAAVSEKRNQETPTPVTNTITKEEKKRNLINLLNRAEQTARGLAIILCTIVAVVFIIRWIQNTRRNKV